MVGPIGIVFTTTAIVHVAFATLVAYDSRRRGHNRNLWFVGTLTFGVVGTIVYLLVRNNSHVPPERRHGTPTRTLAARVGVVVLVAGAFWIVASLLAPILIVDTDPTTSDISGAVSTGTGLKRRRFETLALVVGAAVGIVVSWKANNLNVLD